MANEYTIALTAAILAAAAFLVALSQATMEYISSGSARYKASAAAIGSSSAHTRWRWSASDWKLKVHYPLLDFEPAKIINLARLAREEDYYQNMWEDTRKTIMNTRGGSCGWRCVKGTDLLTKWTLTDGLNVLIGVNRKGERNIITFSDLDWRGKVRFLRYRLGHRWAPLQIPRASWAQLLMAFGVRDTSALIITRCDVDTVHTNLDTPTQRISLRKLGRLAFTLGFTSVEIDVDNRTFTALGPHAAIRTEEVNTSGKIIRFDGNVLELYRITNQQPTHYVAKSSRQISGHVCFGRYESHGLYWPLNTLRDAISNTWASSFYNSKETEAIQNHCDSFDAGPIYREGRVFQEVLESVVGNSPQNSKEPNRSIGSDDRLSKAFKLWRDKTGSAVPTVFAAATFATFSPIVCSFPWARTLQPFLPWLKHRGHRLAHSGRIIQSSSLQNLIRRDSISFANPDTEYYMNSSSYHGPMDGFCGWGTVNMSKISKAWTEEELEVINPASRSNEVLAIVSPEVMRLLEDFDPARWNQKTHATVQESAWYLRAQNLIWIHLVIIDWSIQLNIFDGSSFERPKIDISEEEQEKLLERLKLADDDERGDIIDELAPDLYTGVWGTKEAHVVDAIVEAWRPKQTQRMNAQRDDHTEAVPNWELATCLERDGGILHSDGAGSDERKSKCAKLAFLLELRALLMIAYLLLHPDSTDFVMIEAIDIEMPMV